MQMSVRVTYRQPTCVESHGVLALLPAKVGRMRDARCKSADDARPMIRPMLGRESGLAATFQSWQNGHSEPGPMGPVHVIWRWFRHVTDPLAARLVGFNPRQERRNPNLISSFAFICTSILRITQNHSIFEEWDSYIDEQQIINKMN